MKALKKKPILDHDGFPYDYYSLKCVVDSTRKSAEGTLFKRKPLKCKTTMLNCGEYGGSQ